MNNSLTHIAAIGQKFLCSSIFCFFGFQFVYYRFSFGEWLVFGLKYTLNLFYILGGQCAFSGGDGFVIGVGLRCGDHFLDVANSNDLTPAVFYSIAFRLYLTVLTSQ